MEVPEDNPLDLKYSSLAVTRAQIALIDGVYKSETGMSQKEIKEVLLKKYEDEKAKEFFLKNNASHFCHEILHCMGLFHMNTFNPNLIKKSEIPNMMLHDSRFIRIKFTEENSLGYCLTTSQQKLIHSYIAGKNAYKAFIESQKDIWFYLDNLAEANNVKRI